MIKKVWLLLFCLNAFCSFGQNADSLLWTGKLTNYTIYLYGLPDTDTISVETALKIRKLASQPNDYPITRFCFALVTRGRPMYRVECSEGDSLSPRQDSLKLYIGRRNWLFFDSIIGQNKNGERISYQPRKYYIR